MNRKQTNIPAEALVLALKQLAHERGLQVVFQSEVVGTVQTHGATGQLTTAEALTQLLEGTNLVYRYLDDTTITILRASDSSGSGARPAEPNSAPPTTSDDQPALAQRFLVAAVQAAGVAAVNRKNEQRSENQANGLAEVVVSAQKRNENLLGVPVPVAVVGAAALTASDQLLFQDYFSAAPGLNFASGDRGEIFPNIRGINTGSYSSPTVGIVVDDVAYGSSIIIDGSGAAPNINPSDLGRIEVLRGPQGTLYGANSLGGLVKFVTVDPSTAGFTGNFSAGTSAVYSGAQAGYNFNGGVNVPISGDLAVRGSAYAQQLPGYISNPVTGARGINATQMDGGHVAVLWSPSDALSLKFGALIQHLESNGLTFSGAQGLGDLQQDFLIGTGPNSNDGEIFSAAIHAKLGDVDLTSITGYNRVKTTNINDATIFCQGTEAAFGVCGAASHQTATTDKYTQELRFSSSIGSSFDWLVGGYWTKENTSDDYVTAAVDPATGEQVGIYGTFRITEPYEEYAAFADLTFHFTDRFNIQVGGRQSRDEIYSELQSVTGPQAASFSSSSVFIAQSVSTTEYPFTWQATPQFKFNSDVMMYARVATGFRPGTGNQPVAVAQGAPPAAEPDKTTDYELGTKGTAFDHTLSFDASVYYIQWENIQIELETPEGNGYATNGSGAKSRGIDLAAQWIPAAGLNIGGWVAFTDAELAQAFPQSSAAYGQPGDRLPYSSRISGNLSIDQSFHLWGETTGQVGGLATYVGDRVGDFTRSAVRQEFGGYARLDLHASMFYQSWKFHLFANNIADRRGILGGGLDSFHPGDPFIYITPRTVGISVEKNWP